MLVVTALAAAFWILVLSPKREEASKLATGVEQQEVALTEAQSRLAEATAARADFSSDYRQLVVLGKAVPAGDETASLLVELNRVANRADVRFESLQLDSSGGGETVGLAPEASATAAPTATVSPTEAAAALLPLGAAVGSAGLGVMPYKLSFTGSFFQMADFIHGIDSLIDAGKDDIAVDGRLVTLDGFSLTEDTDAGFPQLKANFSVTTYLVPPDQGITAGASPTSPAIPTSTESATTTGTPSSYTEPAQ